MHRLTAALPILALLALLPATASAQLEVGIEAGLSINTFDGPDNLTGISIPTSPARLGVEAAENLMIEMLFNVARVSQGESSNSVLTLIPGLNFALGESGAYARGEVAIQRAAFDTGGSDGSRTQFGLGGAIGLKKPIEGSPVFYRLEAGFDRWLENEDDQLAAFNAIRFLFGLTMVVGG